jgi:hypothetical protein
MQCRVSDLGFGGDERHLMLSEPGKYYARKVYAYLLSRTSPDPEGRSWPPAKLHGLETHSINEQTSGFSFSSIKNL